MRRASDRSGRPVKTVARLQHQGLIVRRPCRAIFLIDAGRRGWWGIGMTKVMIEGFSSQRSRVPKDIENEQIIYKSTQQSEPKIFEIRLPQIYATED